MLDISFTKLWVWESSVRSQCRNQRNAPCHQSMEPMANLHILGFEFITYLPHSPDLALRDFFLFSELECSMERNSRTEGYLEDTFEQNYNRITNMI